ncbi:MAG: UDP-glucose dehydrogenase family protein [Thermoplasmatota archaeon]
MSVDSVSIVGSGYVGMITGMGLCDLGFDVIFLDVDRSKIDLINSRKPPIFEKGLSEMMQKKKGHYRATSDYNDAVKNSQVTIICVGTPSNDDGSIDLTYVKESAKSIGDSLKGKNGYHTIIVKSTVLPGTTLQVVKPALEETSGKRAFEEFGLAMNPEFLREGVALDDFFNGDRIVLGSDDERTGSVLEELYSKLDMTKMSTGIMTAEMIKYASNSFLALKISYANEIGNYCKKVGIDPYEVFRGVGLDSRISPKFFGSGIGFGGSCFPKDVNALRSDFRRLGLNPILLDGTIKVNDEQPLLMVDLMISRIGDLRGKTIGILGLAFKPDTDDIRYTRALPIVKYLISKGAHVKAFDPKATDHFKEIVPEIEYAENAEDVLDSDAVLLLTEWEEFRKLDFTNTAVFDGRRLKEASGARYYEGICW